MKLSELKRAFFPRSFLKIWKWMLTVTVGFFALVAAISGQWWIALVGPTGTFSIVFVANFSSRNMSLR